MDRVSYNIVRDMVCDIKYDIDRGLKTTDSHFINGLEIIDKEAKYHINGLQITLR